jgi:predicted metalloprotease with PDZ domain
VNGRSDYLPLLEEVLATVGCCLQVQPSALLHESMFGFRTVSEGGGLKVQSVLPGSPAERAGLSKDDEIVACNGWKVEGNLNDLVRQSVEGESSLTVFEQRKLRTIVMKRDARTYFDSVRIQQLEGADVEARKAFTAWTGLEW